MFLFEIQYFDIKLNQPGNNVLILFTRSSLVLQLESSKNIIPSMKAKLVSPYIVFFVVLTFVYTDMFTIINE